MVRFNSLRSVCSDLTSFKERFWFASILFSIKSSFLRNSLYLSSPTLWRARTRLSCSFASDDCSIGCLGSGAFAGGGGSSGMVMFI